MKKRILSLFLVLLTLSLSVSGSFGSIYASADGGSHTDLSAAQILANIQNQFGFDYSGYNYYITRSDEGENWQTWRRSYSIALTAPAGQEVHIVNDDYATSGYANQYKISCEPSLESTVTTFNFNYVVFKANDSVIWAYGLYYTSANNYPETVFYTVDSPYYYESNMPVFFGDDQLNRDDYVLSISYSSATDSVVYFANNLSDDTTFHALYGLRTATDARTFNFELPAGVAINNALSLQEVRDFATYYGCDTMDVIAYITLYDGINVVGSESLTISELLADPSGDEYYSDYEEYEDFPDPEDYFDDPPDFPSLEPLPDFPGFDPDHPWQSLFDILEWIGDCIKTPFINLFRILQWLVQTIIYYISNGFLYLKDCFTVIVHNLQHLIHNLVVKLRILFTSLFVPNITKMKEKVLDIPIIAQIRSAFNAASISNHAINITLLDEPCTISALDSMGASACSVLYNLSTVAIYATAAIGLFNLILSIFGINLKSGGD